jgi:hypothetical protein
MTKKRPDLKPAKVPAAPPSSQNVVRELDGDRCRRCGHFRHSHWTRGCIGVCCCSAARYLE